MSANQSALGAFRPRVLARECGGWLAVSPSWSRFSIGVTAPSEREAEELFRTEFEKWVLTVDGTEKEST